jgi:hypothetical protein
LPVAEAFEKKMALIAPSYADLLGLGQAYKKHLVLGAKNTIKKLHAAGKEVWMVTAILILLLK